MVALGSRVPLVVLKAFDHLDEAFSFAGYCFLGAGHFDEDRITGIEFKDNAEHSVVLNLLHRAGGERSTTHRFLVGPFKLDDVCDRLADFLLLNLRIGLLQPIELADPTGDVRFDSARSAHDRHARCVFPLSRCTEFVFDNVRLGWNGFPRSWFFNHDFATREL